jgi:diguanylate cyclase (GGDEF)-like protein
LIQGPNNWFVRTFSVPTDDIDLVRAQFGAFARQIPLLYFILATNAVAVAYAFAAFGPPWMTIYIPGVLCFLCFARGVMWWRVKPQNTPDDVAIAHMRRTNRLAFLITVAFVAWGLSLYGYGDAYAKGQVVFFIALTMISSNFCLMHLRTAVFSVTLVGVVPFSLFFFFSDGGQFREAAITLALVAFGMFKMLMVNFRDFATLIVSRRSLIEKQAETQRLSDENLRLANLDALSGLPNRRALMSRLADFRGETGVGVQTTSVVFADLDGFKDVNDAFGHETGDRLIVIVARDFARFLPSGTMLARLGGDEFAALMCGDDAPAAAEAFAQQIVGCLNRPVRIGEIQIKVGVSVGVAHAGPSECGAEELFRRADLAMYCVKANGKSGVKVYEPQLDLERLRRQALEEQIRRGLNDGEFEVFYQPIFDARSTKVVAVEALLRWPRRREGSLSPDQFIPVAETSGLINALGVFVLRRACTDFREIDDLRVSVNVSPAQFRDPDFEAKVAAVLREIDFPPQRLEFELTEGYLIDHPQRASDAISALKGLGASVALDDFGTGYTSIAYLQQYGFSRIKIDKSLTSRILSDDRAGVLVAGAVYLANGLEMAVTAEGVETEEQASMLRLAGCGSLQGYLYGRPKALSDLLVGELAPSRAAAARRA